MTHRVCTTCNRIHTWRGPRCHPCQRAHDAQRNAARRNGGHTSPEWQATSRRIRAEWVATHGWWCPGDEHHGHHPTHDLTVHHPTPLKDGGPLLNQDFRVVCRSANSSMGARMDVTYRDGTSPLD
jgi:hypothetical protein